MDIAKDTAVTITYKVADDKGRLIEESKGPMAYLHGGYGNLFPKIEAELEGKTTGFQTTVALSPADAFGERDDSLLRTIPKAEFPPGVKVGGQLEGSDGAGGTRVWNVVKIKGPDVHLDGNHPLAGQSLKFSLKVLGVRAATEEELAHGHVHGEHGHHH